MIGGEDTDAITRLESRSNKAAGVCVARRVKVAEACFTRWPVVRELGHCDSAGFRMLGEQQAEIPGIAARFWIRNGHSFGKPQRHKDTKFCVFVSLWLILPYGVITTFPNTSRLSIMRRPSIAPSSGSALWMMGCILPCWIKSISACRLSS